MTGRADPAGALAADSAGAVVNRLRERGWLVLDVRDRRRRPVRRNLAPRAGPRNWLPPRSVDVELSLRQRGGHAPQRDHPARPR